MFSSNFLWEGHSHSDCASIYFKISLTCCRKDSVNGKFFLCILWSLKLSKVLERCRACPLNVTNLIFRRRLSVIFAPITFRHLGLFFFFFFFHSFFFSFLNTSRIIVTHNYFVCVNLRQKVKNFSSSKASGGWNIFTYFGKLHSYSLRTKLILIDALTRSDKWFSWGHLMLEI